MFRQNLWKLLLTVFCIGWAVSELIPVQDREFGDYVWQQVRARNDEFSALMKEAGARVAAKDARSIYTALKQIGKERKIDLSVFFPQIRLERSLKNVEKRNSILLDELLKDSKGSLQLGLDLKGGVAFTLEIDPRALASMPAETRRENLTKSIQIIKDRIDGLGIAEPVVRPVGDLRIEVQLPGVSTKENPEILANLKKPARLDFRMVHEGTGAFEQDPGEPPPGYEVMTTEEEDRATGATRLEYYIVKRRPEMTGEGIKSAYVHMDEFGRFMILFSFNSEGARRFGEITTENVGRLLGIVLDGKLYSSPVIRTPITGGSGQIEGTFTQREAFDLANVLNNPLAVPLNVVEQYEVGPSLARDAVESGRLAFLIGAGLTAAFIMFFYTIGGMLAVLAMMCNVVILLGVMAGIGATLTMPGIAGIVLTLAMSVDSNILIFERIREELKLGKTLPVALHAGFDKALSAILDGNLTTLLTAGIMIWLGTGPVKGFGITLAIGIFTTMLAALIISRLLLEWVINGGLVKRLPMFSILQSTNYDFLGWARPAFFASWLLVAVGVVTLFAKGERIYGIDFTGGDQVSLTFTRKLDLAEVRRVAASAGIEDINPSYRQSIGSDHETLVIQAPFDQAKPVVAALQAACPEAQLTIEGEARIGPSVGDEIKTNAAWAVFWSLVGILVYVAFRFEIGYGVGAVVATVHDLLMTIGIFVLFDRQFNAAMVAAVLLIIGYSINDTIVVFDRIREELKINPNSTLREIITRSLNLTLSRTVITGGTTLMTAIVLLVVAGGEVNDIAFTLLIGVITGTFSSLFIASPVFYWWHKGDRKHVEAHHDITPKYEWAGSSRASR